MKKSAGWIRKVGLRGVLAASLMAFGSCSRNDFPQSVSIADYRRPQPHEIPFRLAASIPPENLPRIIEMGRKLFFDPRLSSSGLISCASCHNPAFHWTDSLKSSIENRSKRTMSLFNIGWDHGFLWSGTVGSLSAQAVFPLTARLGMNADPRETALRLKEIPGYREELPEVMKGLVTNPDVISSASILAPLEFFVATIMSPEAPFDRWVAGDKNALTEEQKRGFDLFTGKAGCSDCHYGWRFSDGNIYDIGLKIDEKDELALDLSIALTKAVGLRNIADRPPYTHRGDLATLEQVIDFYDRGGDENRPTKSDKIRKLGLSIEEKRQLVQFLRSLSGPMPPVTIPMLPR